MSTLPELLRKSAVRQLDEFCIRAANDPYRPRHLRYRVEGVQVFLVEVRRYRNEPDRHKELPMAKIRFSPELQQWTLHHQNGEHWQLYLNIQPSLDFGRLLTAIKQDPLGYFWQE